MKKESTREKIQNAMLDLMETMDADKITAITLAQRAGISRATLYRYYDSVENLLNEMEYHLLEGMRDSSRYYISTKIDLKRLDLPNPAFVAVSRYMRENKKIFLALTGPHGDGRFLRKYHNFIREFYCGKLAFEGIPLKNADIYFECLLTGNDASMRYWLEKRPDLSEEEIAVIAQKLFFGPFLC